ncbi:MAG: hypothetical protein FJW97_10195 [Actinobacteria bacterium]|nr:hypothetical protein [Actinomycetota bacterium]
MSDESRRKLKDFWQLHIPLVLVLTLCTFATIVEVRRAGEGVDRAFVYSFQWPLIGVFAVVVWNHYRRHGNLTKWFTDRYRNRIDQYQREDAAPDAENLDADAIAWQEHVRELRLKDPPGGPPSADR